MNKILIGRTDRADFPDLSLKNIAVKVDTGAYTSSIHCTEILEMDGKLTCLFLDKEHPAYNKKKFVFTEYTSVIVRSSNGIAQKRYAIKTKIHILGKSYPISLSLNNRSDMRFPVLLGRKFLSGKFIVDPQLNNISIKDENLDNEH